MNFIKQHWFGALITLILLFSAILFVIVVLSPRYDNQKRGFIPCTETMADELLACSNKSFCMLGAVLNNSVCDAKVILNGLGDWVKGKQPAPWSNYFFTPDLTPDEETEAGVAEFYQDNPNLREEMERLKQLNQKLEQNQPAAEAPEIIPESTEDQPSIKEEETDVESE